MNDITIEIRPFSADRLPDFLSFFDGDAFSDNPKWSSCYCQCYYEDHSRVVWKDRTAAQNRAFACERGAMGEMQGYLAYVGGRVAGWCNAAPRHMLRALDDEPTPDAELVGAIICFLVAPQFRGRECRLRCWRQLATGSGRRGFASRKRILDLTRPLQPKITSGHSACTWQQGSPSTARTATAAFMCESSCSACLQASLPALVDMTLNPAINRTPIGATSSAHVGAGAGTSHV